MDQVTVIDGKIFECNQCGECCRHLDKIPKMKEYNRGDGVCRYLFNNKCSIYNQRPNICRGEYIYHMYFEGMDVEQYYSLLHYYCDIIRGGNLDGQRLYKDIRSSGLKKG